MHPGVINFKLNKSFITISLHNYCTILSFAYVSKHNDASHSSESNLQYHTIALQTNYSYTSEH